LKSIRVKNENHSVLNTDTFDKRRFKEIYNMSQGLQKLSDDVKLPTFELLLADIWDSLYKMKPELREGEISDGLQVNKSFMEKIMNDDSFENYRNFTRLDDLSSAQSKGSTLALMSIARKQRRDFCLILFSTRTQIFQYER
jgi:hypothetical protein